MAKHGKMQKTKPPKQNKKDSWLLCKRLWRDYISLHKRRLSFALLAIVIVAVTTFAQVRLLEPIFDYILVEGQVSLLYILPPVFFGLSVIRGFALYLQNRDIAWIGHELIRNMQDRLYRSLIRGDVLKILDNQTTGGLMAHFTFDIQLVRTVVAKSMIGIVRDILLLFVYMLNLFYTNWVLAVTVAFIFPLASFPIIYVGKKLRRLSHSLQEQTGQTSSFLDESFKGIKQIKAYSSENFMQRHAGAIFHNLFKVNFRGEDVRARIHPIIESLFGLAMALTILVSGYQVIQGQTSVGAFMSFFAALMLAYQPIRSLSNVNANLQQGLAAVERLFKVIDSKPKIVSSPNAPHLEVKKGRVELKDISFSYTQDELRALRGVSLKVAGGKRVALVGPSGSGKSTLFNLLLRLYDPLSGSIMIDGQDIKQISLESLRSQIAFVSQEQGIFNDTIRANIAFGTEDIDEERLYEAARMADADGFIKRLGQKYDTLAGEAGRNLSGGQRQRLAIARAIYKDAPILLLDEATSALDHRSEARIQKALEALMKGRTVLIIAHRLSTVRDADMIYVLNQGTVEEIGSHETLMKKQGLYALLYSKGNDLA